MTSTFSFETQELLDRADRAIERSVEVRADSAKGLAEAKRWMLSVELNLYRHHETFRMETAQRR